MDGFTRNKLWEEAKAMRIKDQQKLQEEIEMAQCTFQPKPKV